MVYNQTSASEAKFANVADILPGSENVRINVRIIRLWKVPAFLNPSESSSIEMVLVDEKGGKIHATVRKQLIYMFESKLEEGQVYDMSCFSVFPESGLYRSTLHPHKLVFQFKTTVQLSDSSSNITPYGIQLTEIADVCGHTHDYEYLVDVIGYMSGISAEREYVRDGKVTKMVVIELTDHSGKVECALFGGYVDDLKKKMGKSSGPLPIVVVQFAKIKTFRDKASLQNVMNATRLLVNPDIPEVDAFKNSVAVHGIECDATVPMIGAPPKPSLEEEFLCMHPKKSINDLLTGNEDGVFTVCAEVVAIVDGSDWWYPACKCHKGVIPDGGSYFCTACDRHVFNVVPRFRVKLRVTDGQTSAVFVLFDAEMSYIMEKSCAYFVAQSKARNAGAPPLEFESLFGSNYLFVIDKSSNQTTVSDSSFKVKRVCMDPKIIDRFCADAPYLITSKPLSPVVNVESDGGSDQSDDGDHSMFLKDLLVTPKDVGQKSSAAKVEVGASIKRSLSKTFDISSKRQASKRLKPVKIEKI